MAEHVTIFETGPRDGLQNEARPIPAAQKARLVDLLSECGLKKIEVTSFVSPQWVPQLADAAEVMAAIRRHRETRYTALIPNLKGFAAASAAGADEVAVFASASEGFSRKNINCSVRESLERFEPVLAAARERETPVRGYVSCVTDCPYEGAISPPQAAHVAERLLAMGCYEISLGDTIGAATPQRRRRGSSSCWSNCWGAPRPRVSRGISMTPGAWRSPTSGFASLKGCGCLTRPLADSAAVPMRRARGAMWPPKR